MHIVHIISGLGTGGAESFLATLAPRLSEKGIEQTVISLTGDGPLAAPLEAADIPVVRLDVRRVGGAIQSVGQLCRIVRDAKPDVLQGWMYHGDLFATIAHKLGGSGGRKLVWNIRCSDMRLSDYSLQLRAIVRTCTWLSPVPDVVIANSAAGGRVHVEAGYKPRRLEILPNGVDAARFVRIDDDRRALRAELGLADDAIIAMHVARVDPMKDHATLIAAAKKLRNCTLILVGAGTEAYDQPPGIQAVGPRRDVPRLLSAGDIIVSSSAYGEGFSNAIAEGMSAGLVPVATAVGDAADIVGETGRIVKAGDPDALAAAIQSIADLPAAERETRGRAARARIVERFSLDLAVERYEALYRAP